MKILQSEELLKPVNLGTLDSAEIDHLVEAMRLKAYSIAEFPKDNLHEASSFCPGIDEDQFLHFSPVEKKEGMTVIGICLRKRTDGYSVHSVCSHRGEFGIELYFHQGNYCSTIAEAILHYCDRLRKSKSYLTPQDFEVKFKIEASTSVTAMSQDHAKSIVSGNVNIAIEHDEASGYAYVNDGTLEFITITRREN